MKILFIIIAVYIAFMAIMFIKQRDFMYFPNRTNIKQYEIFSKSLGDFVEIKTEDGLNLTGFYIPPNDNKPVLVHFHGNGGNISGRYPVLKQYTDKGYGALLSEYRGYGGNAGTPSEQGFYKDARAYLNWLEYDKQISHKKIIIYGESIGTGIATQIAFEAAKENKPYAAVVLEAPFSSALNLAKQTYFFLPVGWLLKDRYESDKKIEHILSPLLIIHGAQDNIIPMAHGKKLYTLAERPKTLKIIKEAGHNNIHLYGAALHVLDFLSTIEFGKQTTNDDSL